MAEEAVKEEAPRFTELELEAEAPEISKPGAVGPELNRAIAELFAGVGSAFAGPKPRTPEEFHERYVDTVTPILEFLQFHEALGGLGNLPPAARVGLGLVVLVGFFVAYHPAIGKKLIKKEARPPSPPPTPPPGAEQPSPRPGQPSLIPAPPTSVIEETLEEAGKLKTPVVEEAPELE